jgi:hypothetical protein
MYPPLCDPKALGGLQPPGASSKAVISTRTDLPCFAAETTSAERWIGRAADHRVIVRSLGAAC